MTKMTDNRPIENRSSKGLNFFLHCGLLVIKADEQVSDFFTWCYFDGFDESSLVERTKMQRLNIYKRCKNRKGRI